MRLWHVVLPTSLITVAFMLVFSCSDDSDDNTPSSSTTCAQASLQGAKPGSQSNANTSNNDAECQTSTENKTTTTTTTTTGTQGDSGSPSASECSLIANTTATSKVNAYGCPVLTRDTTSCQAQREAQGLSGFWLKFSCNVTLTKSGSNVILTSNNLPDHKSFYYSPTDPCYEAFSSAARKANPNLAAAQTITMTVPYQPSPGATPKAASGGVIGLALNGIAIYSNTAAPGDDIFEEEATFDKCDGHPDNLSRYHYHTEPSAISNTDDALVGILRDGYPVYGRNDYETGTVASGLDTAGGKTSKTVDSPDAPVYHYHVNLQSNGTASAYFISSGYYNGTPGDCTGCK